MIRIRQQDTLQRLNLKHPATWVATWGGCGLMQPGPGTWGTIGGIPFGVALLMFFGIPGLILGFAIVFPLGLWASKHFEQMVREKDSSMIVIDEVAGLWVAMIPCLLTPFSIGLAFVLFRVFDIWKPWPISYLDKYFRGPFGVMIDDVVAGIFAAIVMIGLRYVGVF